MKTFHSTTDSGHYAIPITKAKQILTETILTEKLACKTPF